MSPHDSGQKVSFDTDEEADAKEEDNKKENRSPAKKPNRSHVKPQQGSGKKRKRVPWTKAETDSLIEGAKKHGAGQWQLILQDPEFEFKDCRTGPDLKDKWRNVKKTALF